MTTATMSKTGRLTVPADARRALGLDGETEFEVEVDRAQDALILRPVMALRREDAWAYTPDHRGLLRRAHDDSREGRVQVLSEQELRELADRE
jgi:bifunctional DNA-binding transcriptional regulator/antitoxin component of YhaV-PrlF toxin-antitoxin module